MTEIAGKNVTADGGDYVGSELELFKRAHRWKKYMRESLTPFISGAVAEIGAGIGGTTQNLASLEGVDDWLCVEPDAAQAAELESLKNSGELPGHCRIVQGTLAQCPSGLDTIVYIDVLEHIENDRGEVERAAQLLAPGGRLVVLAPAYQFLFSPFDAAVGHYRRYTKGSLRALRPASMKEESSFYMDSLGMLASVANMLLLRQDQPTVSQIRTWDKFIVSVSRKVDPLLLNAFGRSVVVIWRKPA